MPLLKAALLAADRAHVLQAMAAFKLRPAAEWLPANHSAPRGDYPSGGWPIVSARPRNELIQSVAVAAPNHCIDGWSYASRATSALLAGDFHACRHLSYYAQLRAGLSILSNLGVGLFNRINYVVTSSGNILRLDTAGSAPKLLGMGTHSIVWEALKQWAADTNAARIFLDLVKIRGVSLRDCLEAVWPGASSTVIAGRLIQNWGIDLSRAKQEHESRNSSSYNSQLLTPLNTSVASSLALVSDFWRLAEPTAGGSFNELDKFLLRSVLQGQHRKVRGNTNYAEGAIVANYEALSPLITSIVSAEFLTSDAAVTDPELLRYSRNITNPSEPEAMLARAFLLLRTATAFTHSSFIEAGLDLQGGDMRPWLDEYAERRGFWRPGEALPDPVDLYADIELAMIDFEGSRDPAPASWFDWMSTSNRGVPLVTEMERVGVWSLSA